MSYTQLPLDVKNIILSYLNFSDLEQYALTSRESYKSIVEETIHRCFIINAGHDLSKFRKNLLSAKPTEKLYNDYIHNHKFLVSLQKQLTLLQKLESQQERTSKELLTIENINRLLLHMMQYLSVTRKIIEDQQLIKILFESSELKWIKIIMERFPCLMPIIVENENFDSSFLEQPSEKAYLADLASKDHERAAYLLSKANIVDSLLRPAASESLRDIPETLRLLHVDHFADFYPEAEIATFELTMPGTPLLPAINEYLQQIIKTCQQLNWQVLTQKFDTCFDDYFIEATVEGVPLYYNEKAIQGLFSGLNSILETSIFITSHLSSNTIVITCLENIKTILKSADIENDYNVAFDDDLYKKLTQYFTEQVKLALIDANQALEPIFIETINQQECTIPTNMERSIYYHFS